MPHPAPAAAESAATAPVSSAMHLELIMSAVRIARDQNVKNVATLKIKLAEVYPEVTPQAITDALHTWAARERQLSASETHRYA